MLPRVLVHTAVSLDGRTTGFEVDMGQFYGLVAGWGADCMLTGADTVLQAPGYEPDEWQGEAPARGEAEGEAPARGESEGEASARQILAVVDARGRVHNWKALKGFRQFWRDAVALVSHATPREYLDEVRRAGCDALVAGAERVDLHAALELLAERGVTRVRVDSGGALSGALLRDGLVHEVSLLVQPLVAGGAERAFDWGAGAESRATSPQAEQPGHKGAQPRTTFSLVDVRALDGGVVWLRYET